MRHAASLRAVLSLALLGLILGGCGTAAAPKPAGGKAADPLAELEGASAPSSQDQPAPLDQPLAIDAQDERWRKVAEEAFKKYSLQDQERIAQSQEWYRQAVAWKDKADFQKAR